MSDTPNYGLLAGLHDPKLMEEIGKRGFIIERIMNCFGICRSDAVTLLLEWEAWDDPQTWTVH